MSDKQVRAGVEDVGDETALLRLQLAEHAVLQHLGETDDRVQGRAQLVRHVGEEVGLRAVRLLELLYRTFSSSSLNSPFSGPTRFITPSVRPPSHSGTLA